MPFSPLFFEELRERITLSQLISKKVKLTRRGREYLGLCPFHHEKTPSFTVNDDKGFYHCFGCGAHGDAIRFLMESERMPFMEAVEYLAHTAGVPVPKLTEADKKQAVAFNEELVLMEEACSYFQKQLFLPQGERALQYLKNRGITPEIAESFRLGYAPLGSGLLAYFTEKEYSLSTAMTLGLIVDSSEKHVRHDYFYDRIMFPILNRRKKVIGFGGRLLEKGEPKYLNSPETPLFHKGEQLYALSNAVDTIRKQNKAIVVEGYMDVIALHSAGFTNAVAPLGTAFTEHQLKLLWQACDEPIICFDGDLAGQKASIRALNRALPALVPGKSLQFVFLPEPFDPDDMIRKKSPAAFQDALNGAKTFSETLWNTITKTRSLNTPERFAKLEQDVIQTVQQIKDERVRQLYLRDMKNRLWELGGQKKRAKLLSSTAEKIKHPDKDKEARLMLAYLICFPSLGQKMLEKGLVPKFQQQGTQRLFDKTLELILKNPELTKEDLKAALSDEIYTVLPLEMELIEKDKTPENVQMELNEWLKSKQLQNLTTRKNEKLKLFAQNPTSELWREIQEIEHEIEDFNAQ